MCRKVVSVGAPTLSFAALWTPCVRHQVHTFVAFIDIKKAFDSCWVEATLVRLHHVGISVVFGISLPISSAALCPRSVWANRLPSYGLTLVSHKGGSSSPLFNLLVDSLATSLRAAIPDVRLVDSDPFCHVCQLCADDLVILTESQAHLQHALDVVQVWGLHWRFSFGIGRLWSLVLSAAAPIVPCILGASLSLWCHNVGSLVSLLLPLSLGVLTLSWSLVVITSSTKNSAQIGRGCGSGRREDASLGSLWERDCTVKPFTPEALEERTVL